jgi:hypothetical protein
MMLSPGALEAARLLQVLPLIETLESLAGKERSVSGGGMSVEMLTLREQITEAVLSSFLEVDGVIAEIDNEIAQTREVRAVLESHRDHRIGLNTVANIISGGGGGVIGQLLQIKHSTAGSLVGAGAGGASSLLSALALRQQRGGRQSLGIAPNMLARILNRKPEFHSDYPEAIWQYLNSSYPEESGEETRRERLLKEWIQLGRLDRPGTPKAEKKIDLLTSTASGLQGQTIDSLADREMMLSDVRGRLALMKRDLGKLISALRMRQDRSRG